jgi:hypothetical protein
LDRSSHSLYGDGVLRARRLALLIALAMLACACMLGNPGVNSPAPAGLVSAEPARTPPALDVPKGAEVLFFLTSLDVDYGVADQAQYIREFKSPNGPFDLDVRCLAPDPMGAPFTVKVSAFPSNQQAQLDLSCTIDKGHKHGRYDFGPSANSRWTAEINVRRHTRFQVLITQPRS